MFFVDAPPTAAPPRFSLTLEYATIKLVAPPHSEQSCWVVSAVIAHPPCLDAGPPHKGNGWRRFRVIDRPYAGKPVVIDVIEPRCRCGARRLLPWRHPNHPRFTPEAVAYAQRHALHHSVATVARDLFCDEATVRSLTAPLFRQLAHAYRPATPRLLVIDGGHFGTKRTGNRARLVLLDADGPRGKKLIEVGFAETQAELRRLLLNLARPESIEAVAVDGATLYPPVLRDLLPGARIVYDGWHWHQDVVQAVITCWRDWRKDNAGKRSPEVRAALQVDADLLRKHRRELGAGQKGALAALAHLAPHLGDFINWKDRILGLDSINDIKAADRALVREQLALVTLLRQHRDAFSDRGRKIINALIKRIGKRHQDLVAGRRFRLIRSSGRKDAPTRSVQLGTNGVESYNRLIDDINRESNGLHPEILRIKALARHGGLTEAMVEAAIQDLALRPAPPTWPQRDAAAAPIDRAKRRRSPTSANQMAFTL